MDLDALLAEAVLAELDKSAGAASGVNYAMEPARWAIERAGIHPWSKQVEIMESVRDNPRTAVQSCHSTGKTYISAGVVSWWVDSHPPGEAFVLTTAPTGDQVTALLWREINRLHGKAGLPGRTNLTQWYLPNETGEELVAFGRKPSEYSEAAFQGFHAKYILVVKDEASGVPTPLWNAAESVASNRHARILVIGNPDVPEGEFYEACQPGSPYHVIKIGYHDTPAFTGEHVPEEVLDVLISPEWVESRRQAWGEESALFQAKVLGQFPTGDHDPWRIIPETAAAKCRYLEPDEGGKHVAGLDVGAGGDRTVLIERVGNAVARKHSFQSDDPMKSVDELVEVLTEWDVDFVNVDSTGIGWALTGSLRRGLKKAEAKARVNGVNFATKSNRKECLNKRAELWWNGRHLTRNGLWSLRELDDDDVAELTSPRYEVHKASGKIKVEAKDEVKKRIHKSPDVADAVLLAFYDGLNGPPVSDGRSTFSGTNMLKGGGTGQARMPAMGTVAGTRAAMPSLGR
jgi:hypothetical protein